MQEKAMKHAKNAPRRKISAIEWPFGGLGTEGRVGAPRLRHAKGPVEQRALIAITDPLAEPIGNSAKVAVWKYA